MLDLLSGIWAAHYTTEVRLMGDVRDEVRRLQALGREIELGAQRCSRLRCKLSRKSAGTLPLVRRAIAPYLRLVVKRNDRILVSRVSRRGSQCGLFLDRSGRFWIGPRPGSPDVIGMVGSVTWRRISSEEVVAMCHVGEMVERMRELFERRRLDVYTEMEALEDAISAGGTS